MQLVKFTKYYRGYNGGDVAGFNHEYAARLVSGGVAVLHEIKTQHVEEIEEKEIQEVVVVEPDELALALERGDTPSIRTILKARGIEPARLNVDLLVQARELVG